ncbi:MAG: branched-chain amino acid transport system substrate-binding protein, partial [Flavobacteriaceae bacterium]
MSKKTTNNWSRRDVLKASAASTAIAGAPMFFSRHAYGADFLNNPGDSGTVTLGFNVPQSGAYADEGADELRA